MKLQYDVTAGMTLNQVLSELAVLTSRNFEIDSELQEILDELGVDLPILLDLTVEQVLSILQDVMPPKLAFDYEERADGTILLRPRFLETEDYEAADYAIIDFEMESTELAAFVADPFDEEDCDDPDAAYDYWDDTADEAYLDYGEEEEGQVQLGDGSEAEEPEGQTQLGEGGRSEVDSELSGTLHDGIEEEGLPGGQVTYSVQ